MATLDDKLLGEKLHYYCSSSEDEGERDSGDEGPPDSGDDAPPAAGGTAPPPPTSEPWTGSSTNTGPKGVIKDWQRYKQLEAEKRATQSLEKMQLAKKLTLTCRSNLDDDKEKAAEAQLEQELGMLEDDDVLREFIQRRMQEMAERQRHQFGRLLELHSAEQFLDAVDTEEKDVTIIVHLYDERTPSCRTMNQCLAKLAQQHPAYKLCKLRATTAGLSQQFKEGGVPALLVYKAGAVIGNFVRLEDELGDDFCASDLESFLIEHGLLDDRSCAPACSRAAAADDDSD